MTSITDVTDTAETPMPGWEIAGRRRAPMADVMHGDMFDLRWPDESFDTVASFNGVFGGCERAVAQMARVCRPGGRLAMTFWGRADRLDLLGYFVALGSAAPQVADEIGTLATISGPGVAESMMVTAGVGAARRRAGRDLDRTPSRIRPRDPCPPIGG
jgi:SAM-dependent methyltransferase